jgi:hypothetical protein
MKTKRKLGGKGRDPLATRDSQGVLPLNLPYNRFRPRTTPWFQDHLPMGDEEWQQLLLWVEANVNSYSIGDYNHESK